MFYTPAFVTRTIVKQALGGVVAARFGAVRAKREAEAKAALAEPNLYRLDALKPAARTALVDFWEAWQDELATVRLLDPACGSGAFLIEAFVQLHAAYQASNDPLQELRGQRSLFDVDKRILEHNLYGVDLNEEAVEIYRLSLWIKTAARGKVHTSLDHTIRAGNSIVADAAVHPRAFPWQAAFPQVFAAGGFDVVVGNPPYVRQELLGPIKPYLQEHYAAYHGMADLYVYFYELGLKLLKPGGLLSFIVTNKWMKAGYGEPLRKLLAEAAWVESVVDFGHAKQIFEDAAVSVDPRGPQAHGAAGRKTQDGPAVRDPAGTAADRRPLPADRGGERRPAAGAAFQCRLAAGAGRGQSVAGQAQATQQLAEGVYSRSADERHQDRFQPSFSVERSDKRRVGNPRRPGCRQVVQANASRSRIRSMGAGVGRQLVTRHRVKRESHMAMVRQL